jgi:hypothetical protein
MYKGLFVKLLGCWTVSFDGCERGACMSQMQDQASTVKSRTRDLRWRWRESNPRPKNSIRDLYKFSRPLSSHPGSRRRPRYTRT